MIPILYESDETTYTSNGLGRLSSAVSCVVTEDNSGYYELEMRYPITGEHYSDIALDEIILAKPSQNDQTQPFYIYNISRPIDGIVTINARHISYRLAGMVVMPFSAGSCREALLAIPDHTVEACPFTFDTDKAVTGTFAVTEPIEVRKLLGGSSGSILDVYGKGQYKFDRFSVYLYVNRGSDNGVTLRYGKNITDLTRKTDTSTLYVGIVPYWSDYEGNVVTLPEEVIYSGAATGYTYKTVKVVDLSSEFEDQPTVEQLRQRALTYLADNEGWEIADNITVSFAAMWQTEEYKDVAPLQTVSMGDTVTVIDSRLGVKASSKVIKTVFDVLNDRYDKIELGTAKNTLTQVIAESSLVRTIEPWVNQKFEVENGRFLSMIEQVVESISEEVEMTYEDELINDDRLVVTPPAVEELAYLSTLEGEPCLVVDGSELTTYAATNRARLALNGDLMRPPANITVEFDAVFEYETEPDSTNIMFAPLYYREDNGQSWWHPFRYSVLYPVDFPVSGEKVHISQTVTNKVASLAENAYLVFVFSPGVKYYITNLKVYTPRDSYLSSVSSYIYQTASELELAVQEVAIRQYINPFPVISESSSASAWAYGSAQDAGYAVSVGTHNGHECIIIDGTNVDPATANVYTSKIWRQTDYAQPKGSTLPFKFTVESNIDIAARTDWYSVSVQFPYSASGARPLYYTFGALQAGVPRSYAFNFTVPDWVTYASTARTTPELYGYPGAILYFWDGSIETTEQEFASSVFNMSANGISSKVSKDGIISEINQSAEAVKIQASKIDLIGSVYVTDDDAAPLLKVYWEDTEEEGSTTIYGGSIVMINDDVSPAKDKFTSIGGGRVLLTDFNYWADDKSQYYASDRHYRFGSTLEGPGLNITRYEFDPNDPLFFAEQRMELEMVEQSYSQALGIKLGPDATIYHNVDVTGNQWAYTLAYNNARFWVPVQFYGNVKNSGGTTQFTSDRRTKKNIKDIAKKAAKVFIMALRPRSFKFKEGESGRDHHGFIAQELHEAMNGKDWGVWCEDQDERAEQSVRYDEIIADLVSVVQQHEEEIAALREKLKAIEGDGK